MQKIYTKIAPLQVTLRGNIFRTIRLPDSKHQGQDELVQARAEEYSETLAFVHLLNSLLKAAGTYLPDQGRPYAHFAEFVRLELLGQIGQRGYRYVSFNNMPDCHPCCQLGRQPASLHVRVSS